MQLISLALLSILAISLNSQAATSTQQTPNASNGCASIPGIGSPILMLANAKNYINDALNINNQYTQVKYLYGATVQPASTSTTTTGTSTTIGTTTPVVVPNQTVYRLAFSITDYYGTKYAAIEIGVSRFGIGATTINKFLLTSKLDIVKKYIDAAITNTTSISCGDLKYVYSSFGNSPTSPLEYPYPGRNYNSAGLNVLNNLNSASGASSVNGLANNRRTCVTSNFLETAAFFGTQGAATPVDLLNCLPDKNAVSAINIGCTNNVLTSLQLVFNNQSDNGTTNSAFVGNPNTVATNIATIPLGNADRISFTALTTPASINIRTVDANGQILANYTCGTGTTSPTNVILRTRDFLGLTSITTDNSVIQSFQLTQYNASSA